MLLCQLKQAAALGRSGALEHAAELLQRGPLRPRGGGERMGMVPPGVLPDLRCSLDAFALRVPMPCGSVTAPAWSVFTPG